MGSNKIILLIVSLIVLLFSSIDPLLIVLYQRGKMKAIQSLTWPETTGKIIQSRLATEYSIMGAMMNRAGSLATWLIFLFSFSLMVVNNG
jgi:hypothetical protein